MSELLNHIRDVMRKKHYSVHTENAYVDWIRRFIIYHGKRHPSENSEDKFGETKFGGDKTYLFALNFISSFSLSGNKYCLPRILFFQKR
ncbi:phage integrase N-terminal SAM-like domain-containing protein [Desulfonema magnum]